MNLPASAGLWFSNKQLLDDCDMLVAVFWTRLGSDTGQEISGTVEEIRRHMAAGKSAMIYFSSAPVRPDSVNQEQYAALSEFKKECFKFGLAHEYDSAIEFREKFAKHLPITIVRDYPSKYRKTSIEQPELAHIAALSEDAKKLLSHAVKFGNGRILRLSTLQGVMIRSGNLDFARVGDNRSQAQWDAAIGQLKARGFLEPVGKKGDGFAVTNLGYKEADIIK